MKNYREELLKFQPKHIIQDPIVTHLSLQISVELRGIFRGCIGLDRCAVLCVLRHFSCVRFCDPMDYSLPGPSVHGILQARILEWVAMSSSRDLPDLDGTSSLTSPALAGRFFTTSAT